MWLNWRNDSDVQDARETSQLVKQGNSPVNRDNVLNHLMSVNETKHEYSLKQALSRLNSKQKYKVKILFEIWIQQIKYLYQYVSNTVSVNLQRGSKKSFLRRECWSQRGTSDVGRKILAGYQMTILSLRLEHTYSKKCNFYSQKPQTISCEEKTPRYHERDLLDIFITSIEGSSALDIGQNTFKRVMDNQKVQSLLRIKIHWYLWYRNPIEILTTKEPTAFWIYDWGFCPLHSKANKQQIVVEIWIRSDDDKSGALRIR